MLRQEYLEYKERNIFFRYMKNCHVRVLQVVAQRSNHDLAIEGADRQLAIVPPQRKHALQWRLAERVQRHHRVVRVSIEALKVNKVRIARRSESDVNLYGPRLDHGANVLGAVDLGRRWVLFE